MTQVLDIPPARKLRETSGPAVLSFGSIPDGYLIGRSGTGAIGVNPSIFAAAAHATAHEAGGSDPIPLDTLAAPTDITTLNASASAHGLMKKLSGTATQFFDGTGSWDTVKDSDLSLSDITTNNVSITAHGFAPKAPNDATKYLDGTGAWTVPAGGSSSPLTTKGDIWGYSTTNARLPVGSDGQVLTADAASTLGIKWATATSSDASAWHKTGDSFGAEKKLGTTDNFDLVFYRNNIEQGRWVHGAGGETFYSRIDKVGDSIIEYANKDGTGSGNSSMEFQLIADIATLEMYVLCHNNPADGSPSLDGMVKDSVVYGAVNARALGIWTPDVCPIWFVTDSVQQWYIHQTGGGMFPFVDATVRSQDIGTSTERWNQIFAYHGNFKSRITAGTAGTASVDGEAWFGMASNASAAFHLHEIDVGSSGLDFDGKTGKNSVLRITNHGGSAGTNATWIQMINSDGQLTFLNWAETGANDSYIQKNGFFSISVTLGGIRCNVNATNNSGWEINASGHMKINAVRQSFYAATPVVQQTVTGSRAGNAALADLLTKLALTGLIVDGSSS